MQINSTLPIRSLTRSELFAVIYPSDSGMTLQDWRNTFVGLKARPRGDWFLNHHRGFVLMGKIASRVERYSNSGSSTEHRIGFPTAWAGAFSAAGV
jgi:hypothetical protein